MDRLQLATRKWLGKRVSFESEFWQGSPRIEGTVTDVYVDRLENEMHAYDAQLAITVKGSSGRYLRQSHRVHLA